MDDSSVGKEDVPEDEVHYELVIAVFSLHGVDREWGDEDGSDDDGDCTSGVTISPADPRHLVREFSDRVPLILFFRLSGQVRARHTAAVVSVASETGTAGSLIRIPKFDLFFLTYLPSFDMPTSHNSFHCSVAYKQRFLCLT